MIGAKTICEVDARDEMEIIGISSVGAGVSWMVSLRARIGKVSCNCGMDATMKQ